MTPTKVLVHPVGGLGNRLFSLCAAWWLANRLSLQLALVPQEQAPRVVLDGFDSEFLGAHCDPGPMTGVGFARLPQSRLKVGRARVRLGMTRLFLPSALDRTSRPLSGGRVAIEGSGEDVALTVSGFFQSWQMVDASIAAGWPACPPELIAPSEDLLRMSERQEELRPTGIHVRLGDYLHRSNRIRIGSLSASYYRTALAELPMDEGRPVWIFSDDPAAALQMITPQLKAGSSITAVSLKGAAESMYLLSRCSQIVLANSTFSWWAARWAPSGTRVIAPSRWTRLDMGCDLVFPRWQSIPASFH
jgi:hypothetical protein